MIAELHLHSIWRFKMILFPTSLIRPQSGTTILKSILQLFEMQ
jgi:hypothetical protein